MPPPRLTARPYVERGGLADAVLPRPYLFSDGDGTNAIVDFGIAVGTKYSDPLFKVGLDCRIPPILFGLLDPLLKRLGQ